MHILSKYLEENINIIQEIFNKDDTLVLRRFENQHNSNLQFAMFFIDGSVDNDMMQKNVLAPLITNDIQTMDFNTMEYLSNQVITSNEVQTSKDIDTLITALIDGDAIVFLDNYDQGIIINTRGWKTRSIEESYVERVLRGPREGFTESITTNLSLVRKRLKTKDLKFEFKTIGKKTATKVCVSYIDGVVDEKILQEIMKRLDSIDIDGILNSKSIQELIDDKPFSIFETSGNTERPDVVVGKLLEGRIAIFIDGTPDVMTVPYLFIEYFQAADDYYLNYYFASIGRMLRIWSFIFTISVPPIYLALVTFHQELIPTQLILSLYSSRQGVPFPTVIELILLLFIFEVLREAGTRMPAYIGQALSIVGALVLGTAAVEAKFISAPLVIIVGFSGITGLMLPSLSSSTIIIRAIFIVLTASIGVYGYIFGLFALLIHLFYLTSFNVPFMSTLTSLYPKDLKDTIIRAPRWYIEGSKLGGKK